MIDIIAKDKENNRNMVNDILKERAEYYTKNFAHLLSGGGTFEAQTIYDGSTIILAENYVLSHCVCSGLKGALKISMENDSNLLCVECEFERKIIDDIEYELISKMNSILLSENTVVYVNEKYNIVIKSWLDTSLKYYYIYLNDPCSDGDKKNCLSDAINDFIIERIDTLRLFPTIMSFIDECDSIDDDIFEEIKTLIWE